MAYVFPQRFTDLAPAIPILLGVVMLGMGLTSTGSSFRAVFARPRAVLTGVGLQFGVMPLAALVAAKIFGLNTQLTAGLVLVGICPGGTASNVITYLAGGAVALSITLTAVSTLLSVVATPTITWVPRRPERSRPGPQHASNHLRHRDRLYLGLAMVERARRPLQAFRLLKSMWLVTASAAAQTGSRKPTTPTQQEAWR